MRLLRRKRWEYVGLARGKDGNWYQIAGPCDTSEKAYNQLHPIALKRGVAKVVRRAVVGGTR